MGERLITEAEEKAWDTHEYQKQTLDSYREGWDLIWRRDRENGPDAPQPEKGK